MLSFSAHQRYFLFSKATAIRKGFSGLSGLVRKHIPLDLMSGDVFIFINKRRDKIKLLMWGCCALLPVHLKKNKQIKLVELLLPQKNIW
jgi:hypothetical protein